MNTSIDITVQLTLRLVYLVFVSYITLNTKHVSTSERHTCLQSDDYNSWETGTTNSMWTV